MITNLANKLTIVRIILSPMILALLINKLYSFALVFFCLAALTDYLDGYIARTFNQETKLGILLDPIADKVLVIPMLIFFCLEFELNIYIVSALIMKDLVVTVYRLKEANKNEQYNQSDINGKLKTIILYLILLISIFLLITGFRGALIYYILDTLLLIALAISIFSPFDSQAKT